MPSILMSIAGIFGQALSLQLDLQTCLQLAAPLLQLFGLSEQEQLFYTESYLPTLHTALQAIQSRQSGSYLS